MGLAYGFSQEDVVLNGFPLFHVAGVFCHGLAEIAAGAHILIPSKLGMRNQRFVADHWKIVERHRVSILTGGPTFMTTLLNGKLSGEDISSARVLITGGSPLPPELATAFEERFGVAVRGMFGMTEACGVVSVEPLNAPRVAHSCGFALPFSDVRVIPLGEAGNDPDRTLSVGQTGQLIVRGKQISPGYTDSARNADSFLTGGWLKTGDVGHIDEDGRIFITGRAKDVIIRSGHNIDPAVIEEALLRHPAVELCAAVGQPDPYAGELPVAFVQLRPGASCTMDELMQVANAHIPERPAFPKRICQVERFAMTATGKIMKPHLRRLAAEYAVTDSLNVFVNDTSRLDVTAIAGDTTTSLRVEVEGASTATINAIRKTLASFRLAYELRTTP
jgi:fatty-acyl-CoA synthase